MSYTLRGRLETRLAALVLPLAAAALLALTLRTWWPVELAGVMAGVLLALDLVYDRAIPYQPGWVALPLGCLELGLVTAAVTALGLHVPLLAALGLFGAGWLAAQLLGHALLPLWRLSYAEDGGELGRAGPVLGLGVAVLFAAAGGVWRASLPPTVHLGARVYPGPLVVDRRERLVGTTGTVVLGGIVVRHSDVTISRVHVRGGQNGIDVEGVDGVVLKHVTVSGATLDGIHVRRAAIRIEDCSVEVSAPYAQGIDISFNADRGESVVRGCTVVGGLQGIVTHSSNVMLSHNWVERTRLQAIDVDEMSTGTVMDNTVRDANGVGINCGDRSMCMIEGNRVSGTRPDSAGGNRMRAGYGLLVEFWAEAEVGENDLADNPARVGSFLGSDVRYVRD